MARSNGGGGGLTARDFFDERLRLVVGADCAGLVDSIVTTRWSRAAAGATRNLDVTQRPNTAIQAIAPINIALNTSLPMPSNSQSVFSVSHFNMLATMPDVPPTEDSIDHPC